MTTTVQNPVDYTHELISSRRVEGTPVFSPGGQKLGSIHSVMLEKRSGNVAYAVLAFGGILGMGSHVHPVPWELLRYDVDLDGYVTDLDRDTLRNAPVLTVDESDRPRDREYDEEVAHYYGNMPWWGL